MWTISTIPSLTKDGTVPPDVQLSEARLRSSIIGVKKDKIRPIAEMFDYSLVHQINRELKAAGWRPKR